MGKVFIKHKDIVVPGESVAEGMDYVPASGTFREGEKIYSDMLGVAHIDGRVIKVVPVSGAYIPKVGDVVIGEVIDVMMSGWRINFDSAYSGVLSVKDGTTSFIPRGADLTKYYNIGDYVVCKIINITSQKLVDLTMRGPGLKKIQGGTIIKVNHTKVPRIIGKGGSMINLIKEISGCRVTIGQNGFVWISGEPEMELLVVTTIRKIEKEALSSGLTERIKEFMENSIKELNSKRE